MSTANLSVKQMLQAPNGHTIADVYEETCDRFAERPCLIYTGCENFPERTLTFRELDCYSNQVARWALEVEGLKKNDVVALYMENRIEYVLTWLGLCKAGIKIALINNTIRLAPLVHSVKVADAKLVIFGTELAGSVEQVFRQLIREHGIESVAFGGPCKFCRSIDAEVWKQPSHRLDRSVREGILFTDVFGYVYTSGTTGLPKAVNVTHLKQWAFASGYGKLGVNENDVLYSSGMPLYHSSAGGIGTGMVLHYGVCQVIRRKFSASAWLNDVRKYNCTIVQYIGELCRYISAIPVKPDDAQNPLRLATGNGLTKEIWADFQKRFGIDVIQEFYGATEGNGSFSNAVYLKGIMEGDMQGIGCVGRLIPGEKQRVRFIRYNVEEDSLVRDEKGNFVDCAVGEPGECLFPVKTKSAFTKFVGYTDPNATKKKIVKEGDTVYVRSGDLLSFDKDGWVRFIDRIGDTFRWRGENVSTAEVASELSKCSKIAEANVYGVKVPGEEGRAGCAAVVLRDGVDEAEALEHLFRHAKAHLPSYSVPLFVRVQNAVETTQTFKHQKVKLRNQGIDPSKIGNDRLFWSTRGHDSYRLFTVEDYQAISGGRAKL